MCKFSLLVADLTRTQHDDDDKTNPPEAGDSQQVELSSCGLPAVVTQSNGKDDSDGKSHILTRGDSYLKVLSNKSILGSEERPKKIEKSREKATRGASDIGKGKKRKAEGISDGNSKFRRCFAWHFYFL